MTDRMYNQFKNCFILKNLNDEQLQAVLHETGPLVIFAGAGSGKTRIITARIAHLIENRGVDPVSILAVTFTNKAAREMKERVETFTSRGWGVHIGTFHSACVRWLREFSNEIGFQSDFTIYDDTDSLKALKLVLSELNVDIKNTTPKEYKAAINKAKVLGWLPSDAEKLSQNYVNFFPDFGIQVYRRYQEYLALCNAMDFSDLLMNMLILLKRDKKVREILRNRYKYILVDEYQDTNPTQFHLISSLVNENKNLCVVGDDDQSIYSWRGADPSNILEFKRFYPTAKEVRLEQNYRCTKNIIDAASAVIANNSIRAEKTLWTNNPAGEQIDYERAYDGELEALNVVDSIVKNNSLYPYEEVAVFYRTNAQSRLIEENLLRHNVPYKIYGALRFYDRAEIKDILSYFRTFVNESDDVALLRIMNVPPRGIGKKVQESIIERAQQESLSFIKSIEQLARENLPRVSNKLAKFLDDFKEIKQAVESVGLEGKLNKLLEYVDYRAYLTKKYPEQLNDKTANIHELGAAMAEYAESSPGAIMSDWLRDISLSGSENELSGGVTLMTLHSAKGLEFSRVYMVGIEEGLLPHANSTADSDDLEEERRLFYVGITRAIKKLSLHSAQKRRIFTKWMVNEKSRFVDEIPSHLLSGSVFKNSKDLEYKSLPREFTQGSLVAHPTFGRGVIKSFENGNSILKAIVDFKEFGKRKISLDHLKHI